MGEVKSLQLFPLKTGAPSHTNFREIEQGDSPENPHHSGKYNNMKSNKTVWNAVICSPYGFAILL